MTQKPPPSSSLSRGRLAVLSSLRDRKGREEHQLQLLEGPRLIREALVAGAVSEIFAASDEAAREWGAKTPSVPVIRVSPAEIARMSDVRTPQEVVAIGPRLRPRPALEVLATARSALLLDSVQDPGNVGTMVRTAAALGVDAVISSPGTAEVSNPKVLRASAGAVFRIALGEIEDRASLLGLVRSTLHTCLVPVVQGGRPLSDLKKPERFVLVAGNEGAGSELSTEGSAVKISIPMQRGVESLNVAAAIAVILGHFQ